MKWSDYEAIWERQEPPRGALADVAEGRRTFETKRRELARKLLRRDLLEAGTGVFLVIFFGRVAWHMKGPRWPVVSAILLILGVTLFFVRERVRAHRNRVPADATLLNQLDAEIAELRHQRRLLLNVWKWYLGPLGLAWALMMLAPWLRPGSVFPEIWHHLDATLWTVGYVVLCGFLFWFAGARNRRRVQTHVDPRLEELEKLRRELTGQP